MTFFTTQVASDGDLFPAGLFFRTGLALVSHLAAVVAFIHSTIEGGASIGEASKVFCSRSRPFRNEGRTLWLVRGEVADSILLANLTLEVDIGPCIAVIVLLSWNKLSQSQIRGLSSHGGWTTNHRNEVDVEAALAEFLFESGIRVVRGGLRENKDSFFEVGDIQVFARLL